MTKMELAWLAGLLEGEGSFLKGPPSGTNQPRISIQMTDYDIIWQVRRLFGRKYIQKSDRDNPKWKRAYRVTLKGRKAVELMEKLRPFMGSRRRKQIDAATKSFKDLRPGDNTRKLTPSQVRLARVSKLSSEEMGRRLGVSGNVIRRIRRGDIWKPFAQLPRNTHKHLFQ